MGRNHQTREKREYYERGLPDHHDPTAGIGGAAPAYSALTLRLVLCVVGCVLALGAGAVGVVMDVPWLYLSMGLLIVIILVDAVVIIRRKRRGEPG